MNCLYNPIEDLSSCIYHAIHEGFDDIEYQQKQWQQSEELGYDVFEIKTRRPRKEEVAVVTMFPQTWGSTALGFGGIGGASMTTTYTIVLQHYNHHKVFVYFGGRFAYSIHEPNDLFWDHVHGFYLNDVSKQNEYFTKD